MSFQDRAIKAGFKLPKPRSEDFGLPAGFTVSAYRHQKSRAEFVAGALALVPALLAASIIASTLIAVVSGNDDIVLAAKKAGLLTFGTIGFGVFVFVWGRIRSWITENSYEDGWEAFTAGQAAWEQARKDFLERQEETGILYWREMRGVQFEQALMRFLVKRGCDVETTKGSGDGGIDLIIKIGSTLIWAQCKAHAKPVAVAPIREIAGVCSRSDAHPVVFAVNGYTKSAEESAKLLGVHLLDAHHLVALAIRETLTAL